MAGMKGLKRLEVGDSSSFNSITFCFLLERKSYSLRADQRQMLAKYSLVFVLEVCRKAFQYTLGILGSDWRISANKPQNAW